MSDNLLWLLNWSHAHYNEKLGINKGIKISTIDNPGWSLKVSLIETEFEYQSFKAIEINRSDDNWIYCSVEEKIFKGYGGSFNLPEILEIFREWVEHCQK